MANEAKLNNVGCEYGRKLKDMFEAFKQDMYCNFATYKERLSALESRLEFWERREERMEEQLRKIEIKLNRLGVGYLILQTLVLGGVFLILKALLF